MRSLIAKWIRHLKKYQWIYIGIFSVFLIWFIFFSIPKPLFQDSTSTVMYSDQNDLLGATIAADGQWRFPKNDSVPEKFEICIKQFEDAYFDYHFGVNPISLFSAFQQNIRQGKVVRGGSTISMQTIRLAKNNPKRTYGEKLIEMVQAIRLELGYSKREILTEYAAHAPFGGNVVGLDAASWRYYGKLPHQLSWGESATLAVLPNAPSLIYPGKNQERLMIKRNRLLKKLWEENLIQEDDYHLATLEPLPQKPVALPNLSYHALHTLSLEHNGERIQSSINLGWQNQLRKIAKQHQQTLSMREIYNLSIMVVDVNTGEVKGYIGNVDDSHGAHSNQVDIIQAPRSSGSILKPFLYEKMLQEGELLPQMLLNDTPSDITQNYNKQYDGAVPADQALARSLNIPAVDMLRRFGVEKFHHHLQKIGFTTFTQAPSHYGLSLVIGGGEITLWELARAYRNMAYRIAHPDEKEFNHDIRLHINTEADEVIASPFQVQASYLTAEALQQVVRPESESGWRLMGSNSIAWKTGTSHGFKDAWAVGMTPDYLVAVWTGNADGEGRPGNIGVQAAAPIMFDVFNFLPRDRKFIAPTTGWEAVKVCSISGYKASSNCNEIRTIKVPSKGENMEACPFHQVIHLDKTGVYRVNSTCYNVEDMVTQNWFVLPAVEAWYYQKKNPWYRNLPAFHPSCPSDNAIPYGLIYPKNFTRIFLPTDLKGDKQKVVFELAHRNPQRKVFWYLDNQYLGFSQHTHQMALQPEVGKHTLILTDEDGHRLVKRFTIVE